jgi:hypothetical protein
LRLYERRTREVLPRNSQKRRHLLNNAAKRGRLFMIDNRANDSVTIDLRLLEVEPGERFAVGISKKKIELTCVRRAWHEACLAIGEVDPLAGLLYMAAWFSFFEKQLEGAPEDLQETLKGARDATLGRLCKTLLALGRSMPPQDLIAWQTLVDAAEKADEKNVDEILDAVTWAHAKRKAAPTMGLEAFRRISEGRFQHIGSFMRFQEGEVALNPKPRDADIAVLGIEIVDEATREARVKPLFFMRFFLDESGKCNFAKPQGEWSPTARDMKGLEEEFRRFAMS